MTQISLTSPAAVTILLDRSKIFSVAPGISSYLTVAIPAESVAQSPTAATDYGPYLADREVTLNLLLGTVVYEVKESAGGGAVSAASIVAALNEATPAELAEFQASASGYPAGLLTPPPGYRVEALPTRPMLCNGRVIATKGARDFRPATTRTMFVSLATGSDTTGTGSKTAPYKSLKKAAQVVAADNIPTTIYAVAGYYSRNWSLNGVTPDANLAIIGVKSLDEIDQPGTVISSLCYEAVTWSAHTTAGVWTASRSAVHDLYNTQSVDRNGVFAKIPQLLTLAEVEAATTDCWYTNGTLIYLRRADGLTPVNTEGVGNTIVMSNITGFQLTRNRTYYTQNIIFEGGGVEGCVWSPNSTAHSTGRFVMYRGGLQYNPRNNNLTSRGITTILEEVDCHGSTLDGCNYHYNTAHATPVQAVAVEINCRMYGTGPAVANNNNASTMHDGGTVLRIGGEYFDSYGPVVADVDSGTHSWNIGVNAHGSLAAAGQQNAAFQAKDAGMVAGYVYCAGYEAENGFYGTGFVHRSSFAGTVGTLTEMPV